MPDLEDVLTNLDKFKKSMKDAIKFIELIENLFGSWDATWDAIGEGSITLEDLLTRINDVLIRGKK